MNNEEVLDVYLLIGCSFQSRNVSVQFVPIRRRKRSLLLLDSPAILSVFRSTCYIRLEKHVHLPVKKHSSVLSFHSLLNTRTRFTSEFLKVTSRLTSQFLEVTPLTVPHSLSNSYNFSKGLKKIVLYYDLYFQICSGQSTKDKTELLGLGYTTTYKTFRCGKKSASKTKSSTNIFRGGSGSTEGKHVAESICGGTCDE